MLIDRNVPSDMGWSTWSERPAELTFLPLGVRIAPVLHSAKAGHATLIRPPQEIRFGRHDLRSKWVDFQTSFADTDLAFVYRKLDPFVVQGSWCTLKSGEWGLRYSVVLCVSAEGGQTVRFDAATNSATVEVDSRFVSVVSVEAPVQVTAHASAEGLVADMDANGYFDKSSRGNAAPTLALRFNLEMTSSQRFAFAVADSLELSVSKAREALEAPEDGEGGLLQQGYNTGALDAVRDVVGWNTVYDRAGRRPYTTASRIWGLGDAVWYNDQCFAALMAGNLDSALGRDNLEVALSSATPQGNIACLVNPKDAWVDRSQAPHGSFVAWTMFLRSRDRSLLETAFDALARNHVWWRENRDPDNRGLVSCGTSDVGDGMYKGTAFGARNETGMDNSATHDEARYDPVTRTLSTFDVGLNSALALDGEMLALIAGEIGRAADKERFAASAQTLRQRIHEELWDDERGVFANRQRDGRFVRSVSPTSFFPLLCGAADADQAKRLVAHLADPAMFGGRFGLPNATREDPAYLDDTYWRGRIWPNVNYLVWQGLRRAGFETEAANLAEASFDLFNRSWLERRLCGENYGAETGEIDDKPGNDPFYTWGAMLPLMAVSQVMDVSPWNGWEITNPKTAVVLGPLESPVGRVTVSVNEIGWMSLATGCSEVLATDLVGSLRHLVVEKGLLSFVLPRRDDEDRFIRLGVEASSRFMAARLDARDVESETDGPNRVFRIPAGAAGSRLDIHLSPLP